MRKLKKRKNEKWTKAGALLFAPLLLSLANLCCLYFLAAPVHEPLPSKWLNHSLTKSFVLVFSRSKISTAKPTSPSLPFTSPVPSLNLLFPPHVSYDRRRQRQALLTNFVHNLSTGKIVKEKSTWRNWNFYFFYFLFVLHATHITFRLIESVFFPQSFFIPIHFPMHFAEVVVGWLVTILLYNAVFAHQGTVVIVWNYLFRAQSGQGSIKPRRNLRKLSIQEMFQASLFPLLQGAGAFTVLIIILDPTRRQLPYAHLTPALRNPVSLVILSLVEVVRMIFEMTAFYFILLMQLSMFENCNADLIKETMVLSNFRNRDTRVPVPGPSVCRVSLHQLQSSYKKCRQNQLLIQFFNHANRYNIFCIKIGCITVSVILGFFAIRFFHLHPWAGALNYYISFIAIMIFTIVYDKAFSVAENMKLFKEEISTATGFARCGHSWQKYSATFISKAVLSCPNGIGIQVGRFHTMESISTLIFLEFVTGQIVDLLVTFK